MKILNALSPILIAVALTCAPLNNAQGAISYSISGSVYSQDFDSLPISPENASLQATAAWTDDTSSPGANQVSILGWYLWHPIAASPEGGVNMHQRLRASPGNQNTGSFYSFGASTVTERALGSIGSNTMSAQSDTENPMQIGLRLNNGTGATLTDFTLTYDGEQWRNGGSGTANALTFAYGIGATTANWTNAVGSGFTSVASLNFTAPVVGTTAAALDGNAAANRVAGITATVSGISWAPGEDLWLRWSDVNNLLADDGLGIDNLSFSAIVVPEPSAFVLAGIGAAALLIFRRRK